jgi:peptide subunit release factor 1 (eRF1)
MHSRLIQKYFDEISMDTGKYCFGVDDTLRGLELGAAETWIVWENLDVTRHVLRNWKGSSHSYSSATSNSFKRSGSISGQYQRTVVVARTPQLWEML